MPWSFANTHLALILRRLRSRFGISAPQVAVRTHVPWYLRTLSIAVILILSVVIAGWAYDAGQRLAGFERRETDHVLADLRQKNAALEEDVSRLRTLLAASEGGLKIEQAAQKLLSERNAVLAAENTRMKEDLSVFERLARLDKKNDKDVLIEKLKIENDGGARRFRYSFMIALQGARRGKDSRFSLQIVAVPRELAGAEKVVLPLGRDADFAKSEIELRNYRRVEGKFELPERIVFSSVEFNLLEAGIVRASQSLSL